MLPIAVGANTSLAWSFFEMAIFGLTAIVVIKNSKFDNLGITNYISAVYFWLAFIALCAIQIIPLPNFVVALLSPTSFDLYHLVSASSYFISVDPGQSMVSFIKTLSFFCLFICVLCLVNTEQRIRMLLLTIMAAGTFQALYGSLEIILGFSTSLILGLPVEVFATGSFINNNHYANFLMLSLAAAVGLLVTSLEKSSISNPKNLLQNAANSLLNSMVTIRICIVIMLIGIIMSHSITGNIAFFVAITIVAALAFLLIKNRSKGFIIMVLSIFIINLFVVSVYFGIERVKDRVAQTNSVQETQDEIVQEAYPIISDFPIFGSGGGSFHSTFPSYQLSEAGAFNEHLHNDNLQFLIEYGVVGYFILFSIFGFSIYKSIRALHSRRNSIFKGSAFACLMVLIGMALHMSIDYPLQGYANASYFVVFLALCMVINTLTLQQTKQRSRTI
ncbi:MAG: putative inorganic carbon (HCO3(-)) transporter [Yoonia sp.]